MTEASATDIDSPRLRSDAGADENDQEREENCKRPRIQTPKDQRQPAKNFQPRQVKRQRQIHDPGKNMIILDVAGKASGVPYFQSPRVDKQPANDYREDAPEKSRSLIADG